MADLGTSFRRPFAEQVTAFRLRLANLVPTARWDDLWKAQHDRAFMVAGAAKADLLADLAKAVDKAIAEGTSLEEFRRDFRETVTRRGWHGWTGEGTKAGEAWRTRIIYQTNMRTSYASGRHAQLVEGGFKYWVYRHGGSLEPREQHLAWDGLILPADHPFWDTHFPPNGWGCSCYVVGARSIRAAKRLGGKPGLKLPDGWQMPDARTGEPDGLDRGWGYAPGRSVVDAVIAQVRDKAGRMPPTLSAGLLNDIAARPPAPPAPPRTATSLKDAADLVIELGLAVHRFDFPRGASLEGVNQVIAALHEVEQYFDMKRMAAVGSASRIAKASGRIRNNTRAGAWFAMNSNAMGFNKSGLVTRTVFPSDWRARHRPDHAKAVARMPDGPAKRAAERLDFDYHAFMDEAAAGLEARWVAIHETGHRFHANFRNEIDEAIRGWRNSGWGLAVSKYGMSNDFEFVAESFVIYMKGPDHHWRIKPELLAVFKAKDKRHAF